MPRDPDFEVLYSEVPGKVRANANLPGDLVFLLTKLDNHATYLEKIRRALEHHHPGFGKPGGWTWEDFGIPDGWNPVRELVTPYSQYSRSESMKGSEQVVRSFQGARQGEIEGSNFAPDLSPRRLQPSGQTIINIAKDGIRDAKEQPGIIKRMVGLGQK